MSIITAKVPENMSYVNAWYALWKSAIPTGMLLLYEGAQEEEEETVSTSEKVADLFKNYPLNESPRFYMQSEGGRKMKVHFCDFPVLDVYGYDTARGAGAAQRALDEYNKTPPDQRFDKNDSYRFSDLK